MSETIFQQGIGHVAISRRTPDGMVAVGAFLLDRYCLGVKDAYFAVLTRLDYEFRFKEHLSAQKMQAVSPAYARKLVEEAIAYARGLGFEPHEDYDDAAAVLGDIDAAECPETFTFGQDGKPLYISGPHDS